MVYCIWTKNARRAVKISYFGLLLMGLSSGVINKFRTYLSSTWASRPTKKPSDLVYGVDDVPPLYVIVLSGLQHVGLVTIFLIFPLLVLKESGVSDVLSLNVLGLAVMALGVAAILQGLPRGPVGSGYLCPANYSAIYLAPSLAAVKYGGIPLLFGMTIFAGAVEAALSPLLRRIRPLFPPELSGLVIFFVGTTVGSLGFRYLLGIGSNIPVGHREIVVALSTLGVTVGLNVWGKGQPRLFCALIGMIVGYAAAAFTGLLTAEDLARLRALPIIAFPDIHHLSWSFAPALALPFAVSALVATVKTVAVVTVCQRINDADWVRPQMGSLSRGVLADGLGTSISGFMGSIGLNSSPTCSGLSAATGVTSRVVGFAVGVLLIALGFLPMLTGLFVMMPRPVMGALLVFVACFLLINGIQTMASRMLDARRTLVIGLAMSAGITAEIAPDVVSSMPAEIAPILSSSLVLGTITALVLNLLFRMGQRQRARFSVEPETADALTQVKEFFDAQGRSWGARRDIMERVTFGVSQAIETIQDIGEPTGPICIDARFDEFNLDVQISYHGVQIPLPERRPTDKEIIETEDGHRRLAGFMLRRNADRVATLRKNGESIVQFHFDH
jgi:NCS2 family nucleobase:cation symporter-2